MRILLIFGPPVFCLLLTALIIQRNIISGILTPRRFALLFSIGLWLSIMSLFFLDLIVVGVPINSRLIILGFSIGLVNLVFGIPISFFAYKHILREPLERLLLSQHKEKDR